MKKRRKEIKKIEETKKEETKLVYQTGHNIRLQELC